jgi:hypothetical protein
VKRRGPQGPLHQEKTVADIKAIFKEMLQALRLHHEAANGIHTELIAKAEAALKSEAQTRKEAKK